LLSSGLKPHLSPGIAGRNHSAVHVQNAKFELSPAVAVSGSQIDPPSITFGVRGYGEPVFIEYRDSCLGFGITVLGVPEENWESPYVITRVERFMSYDRKLVMDCSGGVLDLFYSVLECHSLDDLGEMV
jgi:hypothetical protein